MTSLKCRSGDVQALKACVAAAVADHVLAIKPHPELEFSHDGLVITESNSILKFILDRFGSLRTSIVVDDWMEWEVRTLRRAVYTPGATQESLAVATGPLEAALGSGATFLVGNALSAADVAICCTLLPCHASGLLTGRCKAYVDGLRQHACVDKGVATMFGQLDDAGVTERVVEAWREACAGGGEKSATDGAAAALAERLDAVQARLDRLEGLLPDSERASRLHGRQERLLQRLHDLEAKLGVAHPSAAAAAAAPSSRVPTGLAPPVPPGESDNYRMIHGELVRRGVKDFRLVRVEGPYYEKPLEVRADKLKARSIHHLCKTMVMENTRAPAHVVDCSNPKLSRFYMVLVQYTAAINADKLLKLVYKLGNEVEPLSKSKISMRMADEALSCELTGFGHNGVTPICSKTRIPIIMSDEILKLPGLFYLGAGEVDLKVGMHAADFVEAFGDVPVYVMDCTM